MGKKVLQFFAPFKPSPWPLHMPAHSVVNSPSTPSSALTTSRTSPTSDKPALAAGPPCSVSLTYSSVPSVESSPTSSTNTPVQSGARRSGLSSAVSQWAVSNSPSVCSTLTTKLPCSASSPVLLSSWMPQWCKLRCRASRTSFRQWYSLWYNWRHRKSWWYHLCHYLPVQRQGLREGYLDHWCYFNWC